MKKPDLKEEFKILDQAPGALIGGIDEAGRGPLAGPVAAALVIYQPLADYQRRKAFSYLRENLRDSKKVSVLKREKLAWQIRSLAFYSDVVLVSPAVIDQINILNATLLSFKKLYLRALKNGLKISNLLIDGNRVVAGLKVEQKAIKSGDALSVSVASASILAKTARDAVMLDYHRKFPGYFFDRHKGYGTRLHYEMLKKYGPCPIHRKSFRLKSQRNFVNV